MNSLLRRLFIALLLGVVIYGAFVVYTGVTTLGDALGGFAWSSLVGALSLSCFNYCLRFLKWEYYLRRLHVAKLPVQDSFLIFLSGFVLTITPGKVGEVFKSAVLQKTHGVDLALTAPIIIAERLTDVIAIVLLVVLGSLGFPGGLFWAAWGAFAVLVGLLLILWELPADLLLALLGRRGGALAKLLPRLETARSSLRQVASPRALVLPTLLSIVGWGAEGLAMWWLLRGFSVEASGYLAVFFYATGTLAGALVPVPGGLGVTETIIRTGLMELGKVPAGAATGAMLMIRFSTLWFAVLVGFVALVALRMRFPKALR